MSRTAMLSLPDLRSRATFPERMDDLGTDPAMLARTLAQFRLINLLFSRYRRVLRMTILNDLVKRGARECSILDLGCGGCDIPLWLSSRCRAIGVRARICCVDHDPRAVAVARRVCGGDGAIEVAARSAEDALRGKAEFDYITANHFLHHLPDAQIPDLLRMLCGKSRRGFLINDLHRSALAYVLFSVVAPLLFRGSFTVDDGKVSIRKGFTIPEMRAFVESAGMPCAVDLRRMVPSRIVVWYVKDDPRGAGLKAS